MSLPPTGAPGTWSTSSAAKTTNDDRRGLHCTVEENRDDGGSGQHGNPLCRLPWSVSNLEQAPQEALCGAAGEASAGPARELLDGVPVVLGGPRGLPVTRSLPGRSRRTVGAWCFVDAYGPTDLSAHPGMDVPPHPHTGLQTVSWLLSGEILHRDSLGNEALITPGQLNLMTAGRGIAHSEQTPPDRGALLHGVQLWVALPGKERDAAPAFDHHAALPGFTDGGLTVTLLLGELAGVLSPARTYSPIIGAQLTLAPGTRAELPLFRDFEHATLVLTGAAQIDGVELAPGPLLYLGTGRSQLSLARPPDAPAATLLLLGGEPFPEQLVMWWNFVARSHDEIVQARTDWAAGGDRFGQVPGYPGAPLDAPPMPGIRLRPRGRTR